MFRVVTRQLLDRERYLRLKGQGLAWLEPAPSTFNCWVIEASTTSTATATATATFPYSLHLYKPNWLKVHPVLSIAERFGL